MRAIMFFLLLMALPVHAAERERYCALRDADSVIEGCWVVDPKDYPPPEGTEWVPDPNTEGSPGLLYDRRAGKFVHAPEVPYEAPNRFDLRKRLQELEAEIESLAREKRH